MYIPEDLCTTGPTHPTTASSPFALAVTGPGVDAFDCSKIRYGSLAVSRVARGTYLQLCKERC